MKAVGLLRIEAGRRQARYLQETYGKGRISGSVLGGVSSGEADGLVLNSEAWSIPLRQKKPEELSAFGRFPQFARRIIAVPKSEIDREEAEYQREKARPRKKSPI